MGQSVRGGSPECEVRGGSCEGRSVRGGSPAGFKTFQYLHI